MKAAPLGSAVHIARDGKSQALSELAEQSHKLELTVLWPSNEKAVSPQGGEKATKGRETGGREQGGEHKAEGSDWAPDEGNIEGKNLALCKHTKVQNSKTTRRMPTDTLNTYQLEVQIHVSTKLTYGFIIASVSNCKGCWDYKCTHNDVMLLLWYAFFLAWNRLSSSFQEQ